VFGSVNRRGNWPASAWTGGHVGPIERPPAKVSGQCDPSACGDTPQQPGRFRQSGGTFTVAGSGDIAPFVPIVDPLQVTFYGTLFGAIAIIALGAVFITGEYRRGMIRTTLAASPRRGRVLAAKAIVIGAVTFVAGLAGAAVAFPFVVRKLHALGWNPPGVAGLVVHQPGRGAGGGRHRRPARGEPRCSPWRPARSCGAAPERSPRSSG